jgi:hypothetical protein
VGVFFYLFRAQVLEKNEGTLRKSDRGMRAVRAEPEGGGTAMKKLRIVILGLGTARQKRFLE